MKTNDSLSKQIRQKLCLIASACDSVADYDRRLSFLIRFLYELAECQRASRTLLSDYNDLSDKLEHGLEDVTFLAKRPSLIPSSSIIT